MERGTRLVKIDLASPCPPVETRRNATLRVLPPHNLGFIHHTTLLLPFSISATGARGEHCG